MIFAKKIFFIFFGLVFSLFFNWSGAENSAPKALANPAGKTPIYTKSAAPAGEQSSKPAVSPPQQNFAERQEKPLTPSDSTGPISSLETPGRQPAETNPALEYNFFEAGLEYPTNFGLHFKYFAEPEIYFRLGFGFMPKFFLTSFEESFMSAFGILREQEAKVISKALQNSLYTDLRIGWSAYARKSQGGPYLELGLSGIFYGEGQLSGGALRSALNISGLDESKHYSIKTRAFNGSFHIGYQIPFERMNLNIELGLIKILYADILSGANIENNLNDSQKNRLKKFLEKKGWIFPTISGWVSFPF